MEKNKLSSRIAGIGLVALAFALTLNFVYASKNYGIAYNALSVYVLAQTGSSSGGSGSGSGSGDDTGTGTDDTKSKNRNDSDQNKTTVVCDGNSHSITIEAGFYRTCNGKGKLECTEGWNSHGLGKTEKTETCPWYCTL